MLLSATRRRKIFRSALASSLLLLGLPLSAQLTTEYLADLEYSLLSQTDPHPTTYVWTGGEVPTITDPGVNYYHFYYTGTVNSDARVPDDVKIQRIPIPTTEWTEYKKYIITKLTLFYQVANNLQPSAFYELRGETPPFPGGVTPATPGLDPYAAGPYGATPGYDAYGNPIAQTAAQGYDAYGNPIPPAAGAGFDAYGNPIAPGAVDQFGNPIATGAVDAYGNPIATGGGFDEFGNPLPGGAVDAYGNPIAPGAQPGAFDAYGNPIPGGQPGVGQPGFPQQFGEGFGEFGGAGLGPEAFDPRAAAEWTFYYDQFVLWQYYCARVLLNDKEGQLLEARSGPAAALAGAAGAAGAANDFSDVDLDDLTEPGLGGQQDPQAGQAMLASAAGAGPIGLERARGVAGASAGGAGAAGAAGLGPGGGLIDGATGGFYSQREGGGRGVGARLGTGQQEQVTVREEFDPEKDFEEPERQVEYRDKFIDAASTIELAVYKSFIEMINRIDQRELDQEQHDQWVAEKRTQIQNFAEDWRQIAEGETQVIDGTLFLITDEPLEAVPYDALNVQRAEQLTPQDLIDPSGTIRQPEIR